MKAVLDQRLPFGRRSVSVLDRLGVWLSLRALRRHLGKGSAPRVLELGCGYHATNLLALAPRAGELVAVDFRLAPAVHSHPRCQAIEAPIDAAIERLQGESFDVVLLISVLEHLDQPAQTLARCHALLSPGGRLMVNVPTWRGRFFLEMAAFRLGLSPREEMDDHRMYYDRRDLWPLLVKAGFRPSAIHLRTHKLGLNLFAVARRGEE